MSDGFTIENPNDPGVQLIFLKGHLRLLAVGMKGRVPGKTILAHVGKILGKSYKRGQYQQAIQDIQTFLAAR